MRLVPPRVAATVIALAMLAFPPSVSAQLSVVGVAGMRLVYLDPSRNVPRARTPRERSSTRSRSRDGCSTSIRRHPVVLLLTDFSDTGNAGASVVPRNVVTVEIAPLNFAFETIAGNERMNIIMNHELVHIATMDQAAAPDRFFRKLFGGKVMPVHEHPESHPLLPADDAARGGAAVVPRGDRGVCRHLDGGRPRPGAKRLRRDGVPLDGARRHAVLRSARPGVGGHADRFSGAGQLLPVRHSLHDMARAPVFARAR